MRRYKIVCKAAEYPEQAHMRRYKIVCKAAEYPEQAGTYVVVDVPSGEVPSQYESLAELRAVVRRYESADAKRLYLKGLS